MEQNNPVQKTLEEKLDKLYERVLGIAIFGLFISFFIQLSASNHEELYLSVYILTIGLISFLLYKGKYRKSSIHILIISCSLSYIYMITVQDSDYRSFPLIFANAFLFIFIYLRNKYVFIFYLFFFITLDVILIYFVSGSNINGLHGQILAEIIIIIVFNIIFFLMSFYYFSNLRNTTKELKGTIKGLNEQAEELHEKNNTLQKYIESNAQLENYTQLAAHELKAPLRSIKSFSQILQHKLFDRLDDKEKELFNFIIAGSSKMRDTLDDLNELGKVTNTKIKWEEFKIEELINEILLDRNLEINKRNAQVNVNYNKLVDIRAQRSLIKQLLSNLIGNAIKFVEPDEIPVLELEFSRDEKNIIITVADNGIGIAEENRKKVFEIFSRLHSQKEYEGSGIGLAICKKIVLSHNGSIEIKTSKADGSCFVIKLPR